MTLSGEGALPSRAATLPLPTTVAAAPSTKPNNDDGHGQRLEARFMRRRHTTLPDIIRHRLFSAIRNHPTPDPASPSSLTLTPLQSITTPPRCGPLPLILTLPMLILLVLSLVYVVLAPLPVGAELYRYERSAASLRALLTAGENLSQSQRQGQGRDEVQAAGDDILVWIGGVTSSSFIVHADVPPHAESVVVSNRSDLGPGGVVGTFAPDAPGAVVGDVRIYGRLRRFSVTGLLPSMRYHVGYVSATGRTWLASVTTFPVAGEATDVVLAFGSCQLHAGWDASIQDVQRRRGSDSDKGAFLFVHMGDLAYSDIATGDSSVATQTLYQQSVRDVVTATPALRTLFRTTPVTYMYDDHDYGDNNADGGVPTRDAAFRNYVAMVPKAGDDTTFHALTVGRVRVVVTDLRTWSGEMVNGTRSTLGAAQREWLEGEFRRAGEYALMVWVSTKPWVGTPRPRGDSWLGFADERDHIGAVLDRYNVSNLVMIAGDAHMLAADDGRHSIGRFPVLQAAPFAHFGNAKGGPYSHGCHAFRFYPNFQYATLTIRDRPAQQPCVDYHGFRAGRTKPLLSLSKCGPMRYANISSSETDSDNRDKTCSLKWLPAWVWAFVVLTLLWLVTAVVACVFCCRFVARRRRFAATKGDTPTELDLDSPPPSPSPRPTAHKQKKWRESRIQEDYGDSYDDDDSRDNRDLRQQSSEEDAPREGNSINT